MSSASVRQMAERIAALTETRMGLRRKGEVPDQLRRAARYLPKKTAADMETLARAHEMAADPVTYLRIDHHALAEAYDRAMAQVNAMRPTFRRTLYLGDVEGSLWVNLTLLAVILAGVWYFLLRG